MGPRGGAGAAPRQHLVGRGPEGVGPDGVRVQALLADWAAACGGDRVALCGVPAVRPTELCVRKFFSMIRPK